MIPGHITKKLLAGFLAVMVDGTSLTIPKPASAVEDTILLDVLDVLANQHLSGTSKDKLVDGAIAGAVKALNDPYTEYFSPEEWNSFEDQLEQNYVGIGVRIEERKGVFRILDVFDKSPAKAGGVQSNDLIVTVNGNAVDKLTIDDLLSKIIGPVNTSVKIGFLRNGKKYTLDLKRQKVQVPVVEKQKFGDIGYLAISTFSSDADTEFNAKLKDLEQSGIKGLVIDLRNNGGGVLDTALQIASNFISKGVLIYVRDRSNKKSPMLIDSGTTKPYPITMLVNEYSASASEVLSGALRDHQVANLVGKKTYGKGSVQDIIQLDNGGVLKITTNEYLTPKQHKVNKVGLTPDVVYEEQTAQLVGALRVNGAKSMLIHFDNPTQFLINNVQEYEAINLYDPTKTNFVLAELVAAVTGVTLKPDAAKKQLLFSVNGSKSSALSKRACMLKDGNWYVDVSALSSKVPALKWHKVNGAWELSFQKAG